MCSRVYAFLTKSPRGAVATEQSGERKPEDAETQGGEEGDGREEEDAIDEDAADDRGGEEGDEGKEEEEDREEGDEEKEEGEEVVCVVSFSSSILSS